MDALKAKELFDQRFKRIYSLIGVFYTTDDEILTAKMVDALVDSPEPAPEMDAERVRALIDAISNAAFNWGFHSARSFNTDVQSADIHRKLAKTSLENHTDARIALRTALGIEEE